MRLSAAPAIFVLGLALAGCASNSGPEALQAGLTSGETTSSIVRPAAPVPVALVPAASAGRTDDTVTVPPHELAWAGPIPDEQAFEAVTRTTGMAIPSQRPLEMLAPEAPSARAAPGKRSRVYGQRFGDAKPINFGTTSPRKHAVHGVDVSRWQAEIDWPTLRTQGANFAYIKATDGGDHLDPMFRTNWKRAKDAGLKRGAYHFFYWCRTAGEQADWFIRNVPNDPDALPPVIDVEYNAESSCKRRLSRETVLEKMQVFMDKLERHYGKRPIIYTAPDFYADNLSGEFLDYPFWLRSVAAHPSKRYPGRKWVFWQYSGSGLSQGVDGRIDLNVFHGSEKQWHDWVAGQSS